MSKIKIFSLGGLDESGKNTYCIEVDKDLFVFDCGLKYATGTSFGIDYIIPDFEYLEKNKKRIKGVFLTHGHYENMGGASDLVKIIPDIKLYATKFTKYVLLESGVPEKNIVEIVPHKKLNFGRVSIFPISMSHSCPDAVMYVMNTKDGAICYTGDFIIDPKMAGAYGMDLGKIAYIGKLGVLCLLSESSFSEHIGHTSPTHRLEDFFKDIINKQEGRIMFSVLPTHLYTIQDILSGAENSHRKIVVMGKKLQNVIQFGRKEGYLTCSDDLLGDLSNIKDSNSILLICDDKENPYASISKIINGYDKYINLKAGDAICFAEPRYDSNEKLLVKIENDLAMAGCKIINLPKTSNILHHPSSEDLMLMIRLLNPTYYMPVKGEYRYMVGNANLANSLGIPTENILLKQNGDVVELENGKLLDNFKSIKVGDCLIDGKSSDDVGELVVKDREMLSENGIVLISATISKKDKVILVGPEVTTRGFVYVKDSKEMMSEIKRISEEVITRNITDTFVEYNKIKTEIRTELSKFLYSETECKPMIIAVVQEI
ncbi:MAG: ribonuclease J [Bacilli bacterium]|jgi:ribonuclease J|nr:ribonuclease J [Bacilli bacterium]